LGFTHIGCFISLKLIYFKTLKFISGRSLPRNGYNMPRTVKIDKI
jgi:hypothetical protein